MTRSAALAALLSLALAMPAAARPVEASTVDALVGDPSRFAELQALGPDVLPVLVELYEKSPYPARRRTLANAFRELGWASPEAKRALLQDVDSADRELRVAALWALGRVSGDDDVPALLLAVMRDDPSPFFRDKAGFALAEDQTHLSPEQVLRLHEALIAALEDEKPQVRSLAIRVLRVRTGQTFGFGALGPAAARDQSVASWRRWLDGQRGTSLAAVAP